MEDMERYGDYTEYEDDIPKGKNPVIFILKLLVALVCFSVVGIIAFRMVIFNYYPESMKSVYFTPALKEYYNATEGEIGAVTQDLRAPYDDADKGRFFCDNLIVIEKIGELQVSVRFNNSAMETIYKDYGVKLDPKNEKNFTFRIARDPITDEKGAEPVVIGELTYVGFDEYMMYNYYKLVFDGIEFSNGTDEKIEWIRLEILVNGVEMDEPYCIPIYENNSGYSSFDNYELGEGEKPLD
jgi:hypothetical protein